MTPRQPARYGQRLNARELQCLRLAADGLTNAEIARATWLSVDAAKSNLARAGTKLGARPGPGNIRRTHTVALAYQAGLLGAGGDHRPARHGDHAGYQRHVRRGEDPRDCPPCTAGERAYRAQRRAARTTTKENSR